MGVFIEHAEARADVRDALDEAFDKAVAAPGTQAEVAERARIVAEATEKLCGEKGT